MRLESESLNRTLEIGFALGSIMPGGTALSLEGGLGAGKTLFAKGVCRGLGVPDEVVSPSFILVEEYRGDFTVLHFDLYRLGHAAEIRDLAKNSCPKGQDKVCAEILSAVQSGRALSAPEMLQLIPTEPAPAKKP